MEGFSFCSYAWEEYDCGVIVFSVILVPALWVLQVDGNFWRRFMGLIFVWGEVRFFVPWLIYFAQKSLKLSAEVLFASDHFN